MQTELQTQILKSKMRIQLTIAIDAFYQLIYFQNQVEEKLIERDKFIESLKKLNKIYESLKHE